MTRSERRERFGKTLLLAIVSGSLLTGCPGAFQQQQLQGEVDGLRRELNALKADQSKGMGEGEQALRARLADLGATLDQLRTDISLLQGRMESLQDSFGKRGDEQMKIRQDLEIRIAQLDEQVRSIQQKMGAMTMSATPGPSPLCTLQVPDGAVRPTPHPTTPGLTLQTATPAPATPVPTPAGKVTDQVLYQRGAEALDGKRYADARATFGELITKFPKSEFADNARYWIAESYYAEKDYASAILEFDKVVKDYPQGDKVPAALLKQGYAFLEIGEKEGGVATLQDLVRRFPKSEEAKKAKEKLAKLK